MLRKNFMLRNLHIPKACCRVSRRLKLPWRRAILFRERMSHEEAADPIGISARYRQRMPVWTVWLLLPSRRGEHSGHDGLRPL